MDRLDDLAAFVAIIEKGSQTAAARDLRRSLQSINRSLTALERGVGIALINRTTRQSTPTEAGLAFYRRVKPALIEINDAKREAADKRAEPSGLLRVGVPVLFAPAFVAPVVCDFLERYPAVEVELKVSDRQVDLLEQGLDLAVRIREMPDSTLKARRIGEAQTSNACRSKVCSGHPIKRLNAKIPICFGHGTWPRSETPSPDPRSSRPKSCEAEDRKLHRANKAGEFYP